MKFVVVIAHLNGHPDLTNEILSDNVTLPLAAVPVYYEFDRHLPKLGDAFITREDNTLKATIEIDETLLPKNIDLESLTGVIGGQCKSRKGNVVTDWVVTDVGLTTRPCDPTLPKLRKK